MICERCEGDMETSLALCGLKHCDECAATCWHCQSELHDGWDADD